MAKHTCHWTGCTREVPPSLWGCKAHWFRIPVALRAKIWATYRSGQEIDKRPSQAYLDAAKEVQEWIKTNDLAVGQSDINATFNELERRQSGSKQHTVKNG
jgi:hypothetical protein